jgi:hypothetical protein
MYVYIHSDSDPDLYTVGFYDPEGNWQPESDHKSARDAAERVAWLDGDYVYIQSDSDPDLYTVGFYDPEGDWVPESDHRSARDAAERVASKNRNS